MSHFNVLVDLGMIFYEVCVAGGCSVRLTVPIFVHW